MSLSSAISTAQLILSNTSTQTSVASRNIANAGNPNYARRDAELATSLFGSQVVGIDRAQDPALFRQSLAAGSEASAQQTLLAGLERIRSTAGGNDYETAPATLIAKLRDAVQSYAAQPSNNTLAVSAVDTARDVATSLRNATFETQLVRADADQQIAAAVTDLNDLLARFETVNNQVVSATRTGADASDALDERDTLLRGISELVGINVMQRSDNDLAIYTRSGTPLFETVPRAVTFEPKSAYAATVTGNPIRVDGVPLEPGSGANTSARGSLAALVQLRDEVAPTYQAQLDEAARGLYDLFSEGGLPGLFSFTGTFTLSPGTVAPGFAGAIQLNPAVDPRAGGDPTLLRDGGINGAAYDANPTGGAGFSGLLDGFVSAMDAPMSFDPAAKAGTSESILSFAQSSLSWLELNRSKAASSSESKNALFTRTNEALSNRTGVNIDEEMSLLLELEQSYKAASRLIAAVDEMLATLLAAV